MKKLISLLLAVMLVFALCACGAEEAAETVEETVEEVEAVVEEVAEAAEEVGEEVAEAADSNVCDANLDYQSVDLSGLVIGYVTINSSAPWGGLVGTSFASYAEEVGAKVNSLDAQTSVDQVAEYCQQMIDAGVDALVVFGGDVDGNSDIAQAAYEAGIPMFMAGLDVSERGRQYVACVVGPDQREMTAEIAAYIVDANGTDEDYTVVQINGVPFLEDYIQRCDGFQTYMADYANYDLSTEPEDCYSDRTAAYDAMNAWLTQLENVDIVMGYDDDLTMGAVEAIDDAGLTGTIKVYSLTGQNDAIQAVADGKMELTVVNRAQDIGAGLVTAIADYVANGSTTYYQRTPLTYVDASNVDEWIGQGEF